MSTGSHGPRVDIAQNLHHIQPLAFVTAWIAMVTTSNNGNIYEGNKMIRTLIKWVSANRMLNLFCLVTAKL